MFLFFTIFSILAVHTTLAAEEHKILQHPREMIEKLAKIECSPPPPSVESQTKRKRIDYNLISISDIKEQKKSIEKLALSSGISRKTAKHIRDLHFLPSVAQQDAKQPEMVLSFEQYLKIFTSDTKQREAEQFLLDNFDDLQEVESKYGVEKEVIVTLILMESYFGKIMGNYNMLNSLFTLTLTGYRPEFWKEELIAALKLIDKKHTVYNRNTNSSWSGATGMIQFMPSSLMQYGKDGSKDGKIDILTQKKDAFASAAHYLKSFGWKYKSPYLESVQPKTTNEDLCNIAGMPFNNGILVVPDKKPEAPTFVVYNNYGVILAWNRSLFFATTVGIISNKMKDLAIAP